MNDVTKDVTKECVAVVPDTSLTGTRAVRPHRADRQSSGASGLERLPATT
jgi:hypothetical protein